MNQYNNQSINPLLEEHYDDISTHSYNTYHEISFDDLTPEILANVSTNSDEFMSEPIIYRAMTVQHHNHVPSMAYSFYDDHTSSRLDDEEVVIPAKSINQKNPIDSFLQRHEYNPLDVLSSWGELPSYLTSQMKESMPTIRLEGKNSNEVEPVVQLIEKPIYLMPTHVNCSLRLQSIHDMIMNFFSNHPEINYQFNGVNYKWSAMFVKGCKSLHFDIQIYLDEPNPQYLVEMSRRKGDCQLLYPLFYELKSILTSSPSSSSYRSEPIIIPTVRDSTSSDSDEISETDETKTCLQHIIDSLNSPYIDSQEEALKQLFQISMQGEYVHQLHELNIIQALKQYICSDVSLESKKKISCDDIYRKQWGLLVLCNLSESLAYQSDISSCGLVPYLFNMCNDGEYHSYDGRCASARILANITSQNNSLLSQQCDESILRSWMESIDAIQNQKIRIHAERAKEAFHHVLSTY